MLPTNVAAQLYNRDVPVQVAAVTLWGVLYVVTADPEIQTWSDLAGRTVYSLSPGSTPDVLFRHLLERNGVDPTGDVEIDYRYGHVELAQALAAGLVETAVLPEPFVTNVTMQRDEARVALDFQAETRRLYGSSYPQTAVVVRSDVAERAPEAIREALQLVERSWNDVLADPYWAGKMAEQTNIGLSAAVVTEALPRLNAEFVPASAAISSVRAYLDVLQRFDPRTIGGTVPGRDFYFTEAY
jgi:NitT/TauT family transport system substrate-binding protein